MTPFRAAAVVTTLVVAFLCQLSGTAESRGFTFTGGYGRLDARRVMFDFDRLYNPDGSFSASMGLSEARDQFGVVPFGFGGYFGNGQLHLGLEGYVSGKHEAGDAGPYPTTSGRTVSTHFEERVVGAGLRTRFRVLPHVLMDAGIAVLNLGSDVVADDPTVGSTFGHDEWTYVTGSFGADLELTSSEDGGGVLLGVLFHRKLGDVTEGAKPVASSFKYVTFQLTVCVPTE